MRSKEDILREVYGYGSFREGQAEIIDDIVAGKDVLAIMPTSAGKSLCYQIPALMMPGITLVISPLISLMKDQVDSLQVNGIEARGLHGNLSSDAMAETFHAIERGAVKILYVAPERLESQNFRRLIASLDISLIAVDEAHCISQWGHDFRTSYRNILSFIHTFPARPRIAAFTGTATPEVQRDIVEQLSMPDEHREYVLSFNRPNLYFAVEEPRDRYARMRDILQPEESSVVYCRTRKDVEKIAEKLEADGLSVGFYHAGLDAQERTKIQEDFQYGNIDIMVATNAFGMGIDKADVRQVIHYGISNSLEAYYQEAGRAGRDGEKSRCTLFYSASDVMSALHMVEESHNPLASRKLRAMIRYAQTSQCLRKNILAYFGEDLAEDCQDCSNCLHAGPTVDITQESLKILSCVYRIFEHVHYNVGMGKVAAILKGRNTADLRDKGFDQISTYGLLKDMDESLIKKYIQILIADDYLAVDPQYASISLTRLGFEFCRHPHPIITRPRRTSKVRSTSAVDSTVDYPADLFERLRAKRLELAREQSIAPFMVFADKTLKQCAAQQPLNYEEFLQLSGVGHKKADQYADIFITIIKQWKEQ